MRQKLTAKTPKGAPGVHLPLDEMISFTHYGLFISSAALLWHFTAETQLK